MVFAERIEPLAGNAHKCLPSFSMMALLLWIATFVQLSDALFVVEEGSTSSRRRALAAIAAQASSVLRTQSDTVVQAAERKLSQMLAARDASLLQKPVLNVPPGAFAFPLWLSGDWDVTSTFSGYEFTASKISKQRLTTNTDIPGFQKLSVAEVADIGKEKVVFERKYRERRGGVVREDRAFNYMASIGAHLGDPSIVTRVIYDFDKNPNRATIELKRGSRNGERLELFTNSRRSEVVDDSVFLCSESLRQVTLGGPTFSQPGVPRIVIGEYQHFWTFRHNVDLDSIAANLLTAAYVEPQVRDIVCLPN